MPPPMPSGADFLLQVPFLAAIDVGELERVPLRRVEFTGGEWVFTPHAPSPDLFLVLEGTVEVFEAARREELKRVTRAVPGDVIGEHRYRRRPPAWAARAVEPAVLLRWPASDLANFLDDHPEMLDGLTFLADSRSMAAGTPLSWLGEDEIVYGLARKHPALLARSLLLPLLALSAGVGILAAGALGGSWLTTGGGAALAVG